MENTKIDFEWTALKFMPSEHVNNGSTKAMKESIKQALPIILSTMEGEMVNQFDISTDQIKAIRRLEEKLIEKLGL